MYFLLKYVLNALAYVACSSRACTGGGYIVTFVDVLAAGTETWYMLIFSFRISDTVYALLSPRYLCQNRNALTVQYMPQRNLA